MRRFWALMAAAFVLQILCTMAWGQPAPNNPASSQCKTIAVNAKGASNADISVDNTVGGVTVMDASATRCAALIRNTHATAHMRCAPSTVTVTATRGFLVSAGDALRLGLEAQQAWKCIRTDATTVTVSVAESTT